MDESTLSPSARRALDVYRDQTSAPMAPARKTALWRSAVAAAQPAGNRWVLKGFVLCVSCVIGAIVVSPLLTTPPAEVQPSQSAQWQREGDAVKLQRGQVRLQPRVKLAVATPQLQAVVHNAVALFDVSADATVVAVESGEVAWRTPRKNGVLKAGERMTVKSMPPAMLKLAAAVPAVDGCAQGADYEPCLSREAEGAGLTAETALYALALLAHERGELTRAIDLFRGYGERFPSGVFAPEASIGLMVDLKQDGKPDAARAEAGRFSSRFADEPRAADVARWSEQIP